VSAVNASGNLKSRESNTVEFKESFNKGSTPKYAKTMAAFANNRGGYIIFGVKENPRILTGLKNNNFDTFNQEQFSEAINTLFAPTLNWVCGIIDLPDNEGEAPLPIKRIGWIYTEEAEYKPIMALKVDSGEKISSGDVFYRYRARTEKIKYAEMRHIVEDRITKEREGLLRLFETIRKSDTANLGIVNYNSGKLSTPYGVDVSFDRKLVTQVLKKARFIKEGSFKETEGIPVIKVTGNIDLAEEIPVPEIEPDIAYPYIQKQLAVKLGVSTQDLYALIWYYKMKEAKKYSIGITTSRVSYPVYKFSEYSVQFLEEKLAELKDDELTMRKIRVAFYSRNK
jgi:hypothetical protein